MQDQVRDIIAAVSLAHHNGWDNVKPIYCHTKGSSREVHGSVKGVVVRVEDKDNATTLSGTLPNLHHDGQSQNIHLQSDGLSGYRGYDYASETRFHVTIEDGRVSIFDHERNRNFEYS